MFFHRNFKILSWVGHNIFGNRDGRRSRRPGQQGVEDPHQGPGHQLHRRLQAADARVDRVHRIARRLEDGVGPHPLPGLPRHEDDPAIPLARLRFAPGGAAAARHRPADAARRNAAAKSACSSIWPVSSRARWGATSTISSSRWRCWRSMWRKPNSLLRSALALKRRPPGTSPTSINEDRIKYETRLQHQRLPELLLRRGGPPARAHRLRRRRDHGRRAARLAGISARRAKARRSASAKRKQPGDLEHQRVHDARRQRSAAKVLASVVDRAGSPLSANPHRPHHARVDAGEGTRRPVHHDGAGRAGRAGAIVVGGVEAVRRDDQAGRGARGERRRACCWSSRSRGC